MAAAAGDTTPPGPTAPTGVTPSPSPAPTLPQPHRAPLALRRCRRHAPCSSPAPTWVCRWASCTWPTQPLACQSWASCRSVAPSHSWKESTASWKPCAAGRIRSRQPYLCREGRVRWGGRQPPGARPRSWLAKPPPVPAAGAPSLCSPARAGDAGTRDEAAPARPCQPQPCSVTRCRPGRTPPPQHHPANRAGCRHGHAGTPGRTAPHRAP